MYRSLLVPLDGSSFGEHALPLAVTLARRSGATLHLLHVLEPVVVAFPEAPLPPDPGLEPALRAHQKAYLEGVVRRVAAAAPVSVRAILHEGDVSAGIAEQVRSVGADLVLMTTHGRGAFGRFWLGSIADRLVRHLDVPMVLTHPHEGPVDLAHEPALGRILLPLDGTAVSEQVIEPAVELGALVGAEFTLLRVVRPVMPSPLTVDPPTVAAGVQDLLDRVEHLHEQLRKEAQDYLEGVAARLRGRGLKVRTKVAVQDPPAAAILGESQPQEADLVALGTHARGGLSRLLLGSVADKVIRAAAVPVLVRRPGG
jgi:nucleotide-binding universal stress UspA family protein